MNLDHARRIVTAAADRGHALHLIESYSGRGMFGAMTAAVTGPQGSILLGIVLVAAEMSKSGAGMRDELEGLLEMVANLRWDEMGVRDVIAY